MVINRKEYKDKVLGCWMGKNIGGTLGAPFEWKRQINNVSFYTQELNGEPLPNDDLDIQLLWLIAMEESGVDINSRTLGEYWLLYVAPHWAEYGTAKINMRSGMIPPLSGIEDNDYKDSCGAFIRSEIWACISPGCPQIAARYAYEDAVVDHGNGEGTFAEVFCAALESAAFVENDISKLIKIALSYIPQECGVARAVKAIIDSHVKGKSWQEARDVLLSAYRGKCFSVSNDLLKIENISPVDREKGFAEGKRGWDAPSNIGIIIIGLLYGKGDFKDTLCIAVNCGEDTDCTAATLGSIYGLINGIDAIPEEWRKPIGRKIKTMCLNLGELVRPGEPGISQIPADIDNLTERIEKLMEQVVLRYNLPVEVTNEKTDFRDIDDILLLANFKNKSMYKNGPKYEFDFFDVNIEYKDGPYIKNGILKKILVSVENKYKVQEIININWYVPDGFLINPSKKGKVYIPQSWFEDCNKVIEFVIEAERVENYINRFVIELTIDGRHTVMLIPIVLLNGNFTKV